MERQGARVSASKEDDWDYASVVSATSVDSLRFEIEVGLTAAAVIVGFNLRRESFLKKNPKAPRPSKHPPVRGGGMSKRLGGIKGCKYKISSWHLNGFPYGGNIGSTV